MFWYGHLYKRAEKATIRIEDVISSILIGWSAYFFIHEQYGADTSVTNNNTQTNFVSRCVISISHKLSNKRNKMSKHYVCVLTIMVLLYSIIMLMYPIPKYLQLFVSFKENYSSYILYWYLLCSQVDFLFIGRSLDLPYRC